MQTVLNDKTVRYTVHDLKEFNNQSLASQTKERLTTSFYDACY